MGKRTIAILVAAVAALLGAAAIALAAINVTSVTLDGTTSLASAPGGVIPAKVRADVTDDAWRGTQWRFGTGAVNCANTSNQNPGTNRSVDFKVTAPGTPGSYGLSVNGRGTDDCKGTDSGTFTQPAALNVTAPAPNPNLSPRCGINVMVVLDESGSIESSNAIGDVRRAAKAFTSGLTGTGSKLSFIEFNSRARRPVAYETVTSQTITDVFNPYIDAVSPDRDKGYNPAAYSGNERYTNWQDALVLTNQANAQSPLADLVVFVTDGDPTARNTDDGGVLTNLGDGEYKALTLAAQQADTVKGQGSHIFVVGVGAAVTKPASAARLSAISGFDQYPPFGIGEGDFTLVQDFADLEAQLANLAVELCSASVTVTKVVDELDGEGYQPAKNWTFSAEVAMSSGSYKWTQPAPPPNTGKRSAVTGDDGVATFQWKPTDAKATSVVTISETLKPGYEFVDLVCKGTTPASRKAPPRRRSARTSSSVTVPPNSYVTCTARNRRIGGTLEVKKRLLPADDGGRFDLFIDGTAKKLSAGDGDTTGPVKVPAGVHTVREAITGELQKRLPPVTLDDYASRVECRDKAGAGAVIASAAGAGPQPVEVEGNAAVVCVFTNQRRGTLRIIKEAVPKAPQAFPFSGTLGPFSLSDGGSLPAERTFTNLAPGPYTVTEAVPAGWTLAGIACSGGSPVVSGGTVTVTLPPAGAVSCLFRNPEATLPPQPPPEPPAPPPPPPPIPVPPTPPTPPTPGPDPDEPVGPTPVPRPTATKLRVQKTGPSVARPGQVITVTISVKNVGKVTARDVIVGDKPPAAVSLAVRPGSPFRLTGRGGLWTVGDLAPGQSKTTKVSVLIKSATPGIKRNLVIAKAVNANAVTDVLDTRILGGQALRITPAVTG